MAEGEPSTVAAVSGVDTAVDLDLGDQSVSVVVAAGGLADDVELSIRATTPPAGAAPTVGVVVDIATEPPDSLAGEAVVEFDPAGRSGLVVGHYDDDLGLWLPLVTEETPTGMLRASTSSFSAFSLLDPTEWVDGEELVSWITWQTGRTLGTRASRPECGSEPPPWVSEVVVDSADNAEVFACVESNADGQAVVRLANNRGIPAVADFSTPALAVDPGIPSNMSQIFPAVIEAFAGANSDLQSESRQMVVPATATAVITFDPPPADEASSITITVDRPPEFVFAQVLFDIIDYVWNSPLVGFASCVTQIGTRGETLSSDGILAAAISCYEFTNLADGSLRDFKIRRLFAQIELFGVGFKIVDVAVDGDAGSGDSAPDVELVVGPCGAGDTDALWQEVSNATIDVGDGRALEFVDADASDFVDFVFVFMNRDTIQFVDLDGDCDLDVVVPLVRAFGGSGTFHELVALVSDGSEYRATFFTAFDDTKVVATSTTQGQVTVDLLAYASGDPNCCPSLPSQVVYTFAELLGEGGSTDLRTVVITGAGVNIVEASGEIVASYPYSAGADNAVAAIDAALGIVGEEGAVFCGPPDVFARVVFWERAGLCVLQPDIGGPYSVRAIAGGDLTRQVQTIGSVVAGQAPGYLDLFPDAPRAFQGDGYCQILIDDVDGDGVGVLIGAWSDSVSQIEAPDQLSPIPGFPSDC